MVAVTEGGNIVEVITRWVRFTAATFLHQGNDDHLISVASRFV